MLQIKHFTKMPEDTIHVQKSNFIFFLYYLKQFTGKREEIKSGKSKTKTPWPKEKR